VRRERLEETAARRKRKAMCLQIGRLLLRPRNISPTVSSLFRVSWRFLLLKWTAESNVF
jgi:hypothetical protein